MQGRAGSVAWAGDAPSVIRVANPGVGIGNRPVVGGSAWSLLQLLGQGLTDCGELREDPGSISPRRRRFAEAVPEAAHRLEESSGTAQLDPQPPHDDVDAARAGVVVERPTSPGAFRFPGRAYQSN
jgi:hypothetical protein